MLEYSFIIIIIITNGHHRHRGFINIYKLFKTDDL